MEKRLREVVTIAYFDFSTLIKKYSTTFTVKIPVAGYYDDCGDWQEGRPAERKMTGAIISHRENKIFKSEGTLTEQDRALYMLEPLTFALDGAKVIHENKVYTISSALQNAVFTGVYSYSLKYVSVFDGGGENA